MYEHPKTVLTLVKQVLGTEKKKKKYVKPFSEDLEDLIEEKTKLT